ncbi:hypothetical protein SPHV1_2160036 [Novosphingobium sp. KN65.2]|nr:hypothetical protein SPHV1_2160036 [Novosphingobium sp. KN65.2]
MIPHLSYRTRFSTGNELHRSDAAKLRDDELAHLLAGLRAQVARTGGRLPESRNTGGADDQDYPKSVHIDWVRVWQKPPSAASTRQQAQGEIRRPWGDGARQSRSSTLRRTRASRCRRSVASSTTSPMCGPKCASASRHRSTSWAMSRRSLHSA